MENQEEYCGDEINLMDYVKVILNHKKMIIWIVGLTVISTVIISLLMAPIYEAKAVIAPATKQNEPSGMSSIAMQFGLPMPTTTSMSELVNLLKSNVLRERLIKQYNLIPVFFSRGLPKKSENEQIWEGLRFLQKTLKVMPNQKENIIQVSMEFKNPRVAADTLSNTLTELTNYMSAEARRVADTNRKYLESQIDKTADPYIKAKIYSLIAQQIETSMMAEAKENFAFKIIDPPKAPDKKIKPKRMLMVVLSFILSLFVGIFAAFAVEYVRKQKRR